MPTVRTKCPTCEVVIVDAGAMTLRRAPHAAHTECAFVCPDCVMPVVQPLSDKMVPVLIGAGCAVEPWDNEMNTAVALAPTALDPAATGQITENEIQDFLAGLEGDDWVEELLD